MAGIGESRSELLSWLNDLLKLDYTKVEQCGTGAAYCQIMDSIYGDLPMNRVNFCAGSEYEYFTNYKILQSCFTKHKIEKSVLVERLVKCRFQDNLEFLQWIKKFWTQHKDESEYDAEVRRKGRAGPSNPSAVSGNKRPVSSSTASKPPIRHIRSNVIQNNIRKSSNEQLLSLQTELSETRNQLSELEKECSQYKELNTAYLKERDFYFGKLRDIEIIAQSTQDLCDEGVYENDKELRPFLNRIQQILYATEEQTEPFVEENVEQASTNPIIDEETF
ncbi:microtubule-binding protein BIM1 [Kluyveromyces lactis]|uniref:KLLA0B11550p n=1 Tax=Kluyveromyces lactis (strain ATCC 8585 / CBS 2359 / DSM 70799 / NBRC 1267 / NRRL Y-1140 / WM37) TaxID=284590 RepID=Q6CVJ5_KLULA|nr:uncharacterized protein KLLA0_B11550g [Kluyveromyces lactis]CAH02437.1 KLLA0B11550p [Kluyveromyces lactis]|eukprot:XP_452044.1 uncharacterized protein KLLA0_B11550g [Kluyveromyces lactis]